MLKLIQYSNLDTYIITNEGPKTFSEIKEQIIQKYGERAYDNSGYINISELQNMNNLKFEDFFNIIAP